MNPLSAAVLAAALAADGGVYRCTGAHGETMFSGEPCQSPANTGLARPQADAAVRAQGCAESPAALQERVASAFAQADVNLLGGLFIWQDVGTRGAYANLRELRTLVRAPLRTVALEPAPGGTPTHGDQGSIRITLDAEPQETRFTLIERSGCYWLAPSRTERVR